MEEVDYRFHAKLLLENPALRKAFEDLRKRLEIERDQLDLHDERRLHVSIAETLLTKLEREFRKLANTGRVEQFHKQQRGNVA